MIYLHSVKSSDFASDEVNSRLEHDLPTSVKSSEEGRSTISANLRELIPIFIENLQAFSSSRMYTLFGHYCQISFFHFIDDTMV